MPAFTRFVRWCFHWSNFNLKRFEKIIIGFLGVCCISLIVVATNQSQSTVYKSPKAKFVKASIKFDMNPDNLFAHKKNKNDGVLEYLTVNALAKKFTLLNYDFGNIINEGASVPRILIVNMPRDIRKIRTPKIRKLVFFKTILPLVLEVNKNILQDRSRVLRIRARKTKTEKISVVDRLWLSALCERYEVERNNFSKILRRVDIIPPSIALAQAAEESGWGTSRFVLEGNALFGQYTFDTNYALVPRSRDKGKEHTIRAFKTLLDAVSSYALNLNTHRAYRGFREKRQLLRLNGDKIAGDKLAMKLIGYSERGRKYVRTIQSIMRENRLENLDNSKIQKDFLQN